MKAMIINKKGGSEIFETYEMPLPDPKGKELLVKVYATSVNPVDCKIRSGMIDTGVGFPQILGFDVSGVVEEIGDKVSDFKKGDEVYYLPRILGWQGAYAEYHLVEEEIASKKPSNISHIEAGAVPLVASTVWDALIERAKIKMGESILIHAGAGGVGSIAIQLAKICGLYVFTTCSSKNADLVKSLGADKIIDYKTEDFVEVVMKETNKQGVDIAFDTVGGDVLTRSFEAVKHFGRISSIVRVPANLEIAFFKNITFHPVFVQSGRFKLDQIRTLIERKRLIPVIDSVMTLGDVASAHKKLEKGGVRGKIVLKVA
ncbi:MAG: zinc-dependent alcohol dehydrogenase family protein [Candidatus Melainabacteria bacterium]|nr:zinc-dependent alcohol dehydrogenase family protein [Candidatus Melainabacteria bacterium]MBI3307758.1 zinc-dependent alcohol dehydrogenase family protein [Candidatus Melainabacteria bacterium]